MFSILVDQGKIKLMIKSGDGHIFEGITSSIQKSNTARKQGKFFNGICIFSSKILKEGPKIGGIIS